MEKLFNELKKHHTSCSSTTRESHHAENLGWLKPVGPSSGPTVEIAWVFRYFLCVANACQS